MTARFGGLTRRHFGAALASPALAMASPFAVAQAMQAPTPARGGRLVLATPTEPTTLASALVSAVGPVVSAKIFDTLLAPDGPGRLRGQLAQSWQVAADGLSVTLKLRPGVRWHDGEPFTSADVAYTVLEIWKVFPARGRVTFAVVRQVDTPDPLTAILRLDRPAPYLLAALAWSGDAQVLPRHLYAGSDPLRNSRNTAPIGTGPFRFAEWKRGTYVRMLRNPAYWADAQPLLDEVVVRFIPDLGAAAAALETGEVHLATVAQSDVARLSKQPALVAVSSEFGLDGGIAAFEFNLDRPALRDARVRQALAHAIDRDFIVRNIYNGVGKPALSPMPPQFAAFHTDNLPRHAFDLARAEALLDAAGLRRDAQGTRLVLTNDQAPNAAQHAQIARYLRSNFARIGVRLDLRSQDFGEFVNRVFTRRDFDTAIYHNAAGPDPVIGIQRLYWSMNFKPGVAFSNGAHYANADVDAQLEQAQVEADPKKRRALYEAFQRQVMADLPRIPLVATRPLFMARREVTGLADAVNGLSDSFAGVGLVRNASRG